MPDTSAPIEVIKPGALSSFQDLGRHGFQQLGVPANGVMDERAHRLANCLVGNAPDEATLEITLMGPSLRFGTPVTLAVAGADLGASVDGVALPPGTAITVQSGAVLTFGKRQAGLRAYLAVAGGFVLDRVMHSTSTFLRGAYGGAQGKALRKGDAITLRAPRCVDVNPAHIDGFGDAPWERPADAPLRVVRGREWQAFTDAAWHVFESSAYKIGAQSDRMGYRLEGPALTLTHPLEMPSEAVGFGTVQVPPDGQPIVLMADRQTTGGYPKVAHVCAVDLPRLAQRVPGEMIRFELISIDEAQRLLLLQSERFAAWAANAVAEPRG